MTASQATPICRKKMEISKCLIWSWLWLYRLQLLLEITPVWIYWVLAAYKAKLKASSRERNEKKIPPQSWASELASDGGQGMGERSGVCAPQVRAQNLLLDQCRWIIWMLEVQSRQRELVFVSVSQRQSCSKDSKRKVTVYEKLATGSALSGGGGVLITRKENIS